MHEHSNYKQEKHGPCCCLSGPWNIVLNMLIILRKRFDIPNTTQQPTAVLSYRVLVTSGNGGSDRDKKSLMECGECSA